MWNVWRITAPVTAPSSLGSTGMGTLSPFAVERSRTGVGLRPRRGRPIGRRSRPRQNSARRRLDGEHDAVGEPWPRGHVELVAVPQRATARSRSRSPLEVEPGPHVAAEALGDRRRERRPRPPRRRPRSRRRHARSPPRGAERRTRRERRHLLGVGAVDEHERDERRARPSTSSSSLVSVPENDACRSAASPPSPSSTITTRRVGSDGSASIAEQRPRTAPAAAPADDRQSDADSPRSRRPRRGRSRPRPRPVATASRGPTACGAAGDGFTPGPRIMRCARPRPANRAAARPALPARRARAGGRDHASVDHERRDRTDALARATPHRAARGEGGPPDARGAGSRPPRRPRAEPVRSTTSAMPTAGRRLVLAHHERAPARARGPVHEPGRVAGHVRAHRTDRVARAVGRGRARCESASSCGRGAQPGRVGRSGRARP